MESQIGSVIENIVRRLENGTAEGSKKILLRMETSRKPSAGSSHMTKSRESRTFEFLLSIAAEVNMAAPVKYSIAGKSIRGSNFFPLCIFSEPIEPVLEAPVVAE